MAAIAVAGVQAVANCPRSFISRVFVTLSEQWGPATAFNALSEASHHTRRRLFAGFSIRAGCVFDALRVTLRWKTE